MDKKGKGNDKYTPFNYGQSSTSRQSSSNWSQGQGLSSQQINSLMYTIDKHTKGTPEKTYADAKRDIKGTTGTVTHESGKRIYEEAKRAINASKQSNLSKGASTSRDTQFR